MTETVQLRNGATVASSAVSATMSTLRMMVESTDITRLLAVYELRELARDPQHPMWPGTAEQLTTLGLLTGGQLHDTIRDIALSAIEGDLDAFHLVNPVAAEEGS